MAERQIWIKRKANMMWISRKRFWMPLPDTSFRKSAASTKARKVRRFTRSGWRSILSMQKSKKVRWGRGDLSGLFLLSTSSDPYLHSETAVKEICVRPMSIWWRRRESNPRPKTYSYHFLRAYITYRSPDIRADDRARTSAALLCVAVSSAKWRLTFTAVVTPDIESRYPL